MPKIRAVQVPEPGAALELVERDAPEPARGEVRLTVQACGICHSDALTVEGHWPGIEYPRVPGHEIAGVIDVVGEGVEGWAPGDRAGVGWFGGICRRCDPCRRGDFIGCVALRIPGISYDGGYAEAVVVPEEALARIPDDLAAVDAAPLLCAGITTYNALRHAGARPGDVVAVLGVGGLGHLGVQYAAKFGFRTVAIARGKDKEALAHDLGAHHYIDSTSQDVAAELQALGGAKVILATVTAGGAMTAAIGGLGVRGELVVVGASPDPIEAPPSLLIGGNRAVSGHASGTSKDSEDTLAFSLLTGVRPHVETMGLEQAAEAYARMMSGAARFRMVVTTGR